MGLTISVKIFRDRNSFRARERETETQHGEKVRRRIVQQACALNSSLAEESDTVGE